VPSALCPTENNPEKAESVGTEVWAVARVVQMAVLSIGAQRINCLGSGIIGKISKMSSKSCLDKTDILVSFQREVEVGKKINSLEIGK
jgi:hypothetical protein